MAHVQFVDELVKEYLLFRGFSSSLKAFDNELKLEKDYRFRVDRVVEHLLQAVYNYDLAGLRELWTHFELKIFTKIDHNLSAASRKLESALLKFYLVHAVENNKSEKVNEFFTKLTQELSGQADWKDWFTLPYIKYPEENTAFAVYFTRQWQDSLFVSLHNFLASVYQNLPQPTLSAYEESASKLLALQKENDMLKRGLANVLSGSDIAKAASHSTEDLSDIMDDFYNISQEVKVADHQNKTLRTLMKISGSSTSVSPKSSVTAGKRKPFIKRITGSRSSSCDPRVEKCERDSSLDASSGRSRIDQVQIEKVSGQPDGSFLFLSQDEYNDHSSQIICLKLNGRGSMVASLDTRGNLRIWTTPPSCCTVAVFPTRVEANLLEWVSHNERYLLCSDLTGHLRLYDVKEVHQVWEVPLAVDSCNKIEILRSNPVALSTIITINGKMIHFDLKTRKSQKNIEVNGRVACCSFTPDGIHVICGCRDGIIFIVDFHKNEVMETINVTTVPILYVNVTSDNSKCFFLGDDRQLRWFHLSNKDDLHVINIPNECKLSSIENQPFCIDNSGTSLLSLGTNSGVIYKIFEDKLSKCLELGGHKSIVTCVDWCFVNQCATCVTSSTDGQIRISTLLINNVNI